MDHYKNDYSKDDDPMMWQLHQNRHALAKQNKTPSQIHAEVNKFIKNAGFKNLKVYQPNFIVGAKTAK